MLTIQNQTEKVLVVYNTLFSKIIPIGENIEIKSEQLQGEDKLFCRYLYVGGKEETVDYGIKQTKIRRRLYIYYERIATFPLATVFSTKNMQTLCLKEELIPLSITSIFRTVHLKRIITETNNQMEYLFFDTQSKSYFLKFMRRALLFLPVALILLLGCIDCLVRPEFDWMEKTMLILAFLSISFMIFRDVYYYFKGRKWKCLENTGDGLKALKKSDF